MPHFSTHPYDLHQNSQTIYHDKHKKQPSHHSNKNEESLKTSLKNSTKDLKMSIDHISSPKKKLMESQRLKLRPTLKKSTKLFEKAKIINLHHQQTLLSTSQKQVEKHSQNVPSQKSYNLLQVPNLKKLRSHSSKKTHEHGSNSNDSHESGSHVRSSSYHRKSNKTGKSDSSMVRTEEESMFQIDEEQNKWIQQNNMFASQVGQNLLNNLKRNLSRISSIEKKKSNEDMQYAPIKHQSHHKSSNVIGTKVKKIDSYDSQADEFIRQNCLPSMLQVQNEEQTQEQTQQQDGMTPFSRLIMNDSYQINIS